MPCSTTAVQEAVNFKVTGSNPVGAVGINILSYTKHMEKRTYAERKAKNPDWVKKSIERVSKTRRKIKATLIEEAGGCCSQCGYNKNPAALEFHHPDPSAKERGIIGTSKSLARQREEAEKCILVCANCHRELHNPL